MRRFLAVLAAPLLMAQGMYDQGSLVRPASHILGQTFSQTLVIRGQDGRDQVLPLPPEGDGRLGTCIGITRRQGVVHALFQRRIAYPPGVQSPRAGSPQESVALHQRVPGAPGWRWVARLTNEQRRELDPQHFIPLEDGSFLFHAYHPVWRGEAGSPFVRLKPDASGTLAMLGPVSLTREGLPLRRGNPKDPEWPGMPDMTQTRSGRWHMTSLPTGILLLHARTGRWFLLDHREATPLRQGRLWQVGEAVTARVAARPDGKLLVAAIRGALTGARRFLYVPPPAPQASASTRLLTQRVAAVLSQRKPPAVPLRWIALDAATGKAVDLAPPDRIPDRDALSTVSRNMAVRPDGNLILEEDAISRWFNSLGEQPWQRALEAPFRLSWRFRKEVN